MAYFSIQCVALCMCRQRNMSSAAACPLRGVARISNVVANVAGSVAAARATSNQCGVWLWRKCVWPYHKYGGNNGVSVAAAALGIIMAYP